jgi:uncharacterized membrane protein
MPPWGWLFLILVLAAALRWARIGHESLWLDEQLSLENSTGRGHLHGSLPSETVLDPAPAPTRLGDAPGLAAIWSSLESETHPPLFFIVLNVWRHLAGEGDVAARALSVAMSLLCIVLMYFVARLLHENTSAPALWACLIMAVATPQIGIAQEARPYTMSLAALLAAALALVRIEKLGPTLWRAIAFAAALLGMMLTHYLTFGPAIALLVYTLIRLRGRARVMACSACVAAALVYAIIWGPFFIQQAHRFRQEHAWMLESEPTRSLLRPLARVVDVPIRYFIEPMSESRPIGRIACILFVLPPLIMITHRRADLLLWWLLLIAPVAEVAIADTLRGAWALMMVRYTFLATAPAYALVAAMLAHRTGWQRHIAPLLASLSCVAALQSAYSGSRPDWREPGKMLREQVRPGDVLVMTRSGPNDWQSAAMYLALSHYAAPKVPVVILEKPPTGSAAQLIGSSRRIWMVGIVGNDGSPPQLPLGQANGSIVAARDFPFCCAIICVENHPRTD